MIAWAHAMVFGALLVLGGLPVRAENPEAEKALGEGMGAQWNQTYDEAIADFTRVIKLEPGNLYAYCNRSACYSMQGRTDLALADASHAVELDPQSGYCRLVRADAYLDLRDPKDALPDLDKAIALRPTTISFYRRGETHSDLGQYDLAIKDYTQALTPTGLVMPPDTDQLDNSTVVIDLAQEKPYYYRGLAHQKLGQLAEAEADFEKAAALDQPVAAQLAQEQNLATGTPRFARVIRAYAGALKDEPSDDGAYFNHARPGFAGHDFQAALANLDTEISRNPGDAQARLDRGYAEFKLNDYAKSAVDNQAALVLWPGNPSAYNNRGLVYLTTGDYDRAIDDYNEVIHLLYLGHTPADAHREALAYCGLGKAFGLKGDAVNAKVCFNLAVEWAPDLALVYRFRGDDEAAQERDEEALADYAHSLRLDPKSAEALSGQAWLLATSAVASLRSPNSAIVDATKACELTSWKDPDMLSVLAAAYAAEGDFDNARKWETAAVVILDVEPDQAADREAKRLLGLYQANHAYAAPP